MPARSSAPSPGRVGQRPRRTGGDLVGDVGVPQRHLQRPAASRRAGRRPRPPRLLRLRQGAGRHPGRSGRLDHEPRRRLALPRPRSQPRAGRHDRPAAARPAPASGWGTPGGSPPCAAARPTRRICAPTSGRWTRRWSPSSCCSTGCSPGRLFHALCTAEECLAELDPRSGRAGLDDEARRILGLARTELEFRRARRAARRPPGPAGRNPEPVRPGRPGAVASAVLRADPADRLAAPDDMAHQGPAHDTRYRYDRRPVKASYNEARMTPLSIPATD